MRVPSERELNAELGGAIERVRIVREQNIRHVSAHQGSEIGEHLKAMTTGGTLALVIDTEKIEVRAAKGERHIFMAQQLHARFRKEALGSIFGPGVNFMITVATKNTERGAKLAYFFDAIGQRIGSPGDEVSGDNGEIGPEIIGHIHGATDIGAAHVSAQVNVTELDDIHAVKRGGQVRGRHFDATNTVVEALSGKAVHHAEKRGGASPGCGSAGEIAARRVRQEVRGSRGRR